jgi:hypothetical protein
VAYVRQSAERQCWLPGVHTTCSCSNIAGRLTCKAIADQCYDACYICCSSA